MEFGRKWQRLSDVESPVDGSHRLKKYAIFALSPMIKHFQPTPPRRPEWQHEAVSEKAEKAGDP